MPAGLLGSWRIEKILPTHNTACWGDAQARPLLGSRLTYAPGRITWKGGPIPVSEALTRIVSRSDYEQQDRVSFASLGIREDRITEVDLQHEDADITGATTEVPGDTVLLAGPNRIVISACGVYFSALRIAR